MINQWPSFGAKQGFAQQMMKLESAFNEYDSQSTNPLSEDIKIACLLRCVTGQLKQHLNVAVTDTTKYADLRSLVLRWDNAQTRWDTAVAATYSLGDGRGGSGGHGIQPMDVDAIGALSWKGKGKDKGKGKGKHDNKTKAKIKEKEDGPTSMQTKARTKEKARARISVKSVFIAGRRAIGRETVSSSRETLRMLSNKLLPQVMINLLQSDDQHAVEWRVEHCAGVQCFRLERRAPLFALCQEGHR